MKQSVNLARSSFLKIAPTKNRTSLHASVAANASITMKLCAVCKDGTLVDISLSVSPVVDKRGVIVGCRKIARDITSRNVSEQALRAADRAKDEFLAMLGHELRNPLGALASAVRILDLPGRSPDHLAHARAVIGRQLDQLSHLVDDLVDASRVTSAKMRLSRRPLDLSQTVNATIEALPHAWNRGPPSAHIQRPPVWIDADETTNRTDRHQPARQRAEVSRRQAVRLP